MNTIEIKGYKKLYELTIEEFEYLLSLKGQVPDCEICGWPGRYLMSCIGWIHGYCEIQLQTQERQRYLNSLPPRQQWALIAPKLRSIVFERDGYRCKHCLTKENLSVDHIIPILLGGTNDLENLQTLCKSCNSRKGARL